VGRAAPSRHSEDHAAPVAVGLRPGCGPADGVRQHAARLAPAAGLDLIPLLRRPCDGVPARRLRHRAGVGVASGDVASRGGRGPPRSRRYLELRAPPAALRVGAGAAGVLVARRTPSVRVLLERGRFGPAETAATAEALAWYAVGLAGFSGSRIVAQTFYAQSEAATAVRWGIVSIVANVVAALALMGPLGHAGLAGAASVGAYVNLVSPPVIARLRLGRLGGRAPGGGPGPPPPASPP